MSGSNGTTEQAAGYGFIGARPKRSPVWIEPSNDTAQPVSEPSLHARAAVDMQGIDVGTAKFFEPALHQTAQHQVYVPALVPATRSISSAMR